MGMADAEMRERFRESSVMKGWKALPQIFVNGHFVGGEQEFLNLTDSDGGHSEGRRQPLVGLARILGYGGLLPFIALSVFLWLPVDRAAAFFSGQLPLAYGAVILALWEQSIGAWH